MAEPFWPKNCVTVFVGSATKEYPGYSAKISKSLSHVKSSYQVHEGVSQTVMATMLRAADICLIPSIMEATSLSALEAMASGATVVAARVGGLLELITDGVNGYLHDAASPASIAKSVERACKSILSNEIPESARKTVCLDYTWTTVATRTARIYAEVAQCES